MSVLVTGGAGYIGSHMTYALLDAGENVVVLDSLVSGVRGLVSDRAAFVEGNAGDTTLVTDIIARFDVDAIIHFAGSIVVPESVARPLDYYGNNTVVSRNLMAAAVGAGVRNFIFSSTAAVYGEAGERPVGEDSATIPVNPYGRSKLMTEWMLRDASAAHDLHYVALRYFNVAGADPLGRTGQSTPRATHLIKRACQAALGRVPALDIFGTDYPTPDGTCIRDYIHVSDLTAAHLLALSHLRAGNPSAVFNCGYGHGFSVREVVAAVKRASGAAVPVREAPRRVGDPPAIVADSRLLRSQLGWTPAYDNLDEIVWTAFAWERKFNS